MVRSTGNLSSPTKVTFAVHTFGHSSIVKFMLSKRPFKCYENVFGEI